MIIVSGKVKAEPGAFEKVRSAMETVINATRQENGCIDYSYGADVLDPDTLIVLEYWEDWASLEQHFAAPHMKPWIEVLGKVGIISRDLRATETGETRPL